MLKRGRKGRISNELVAASCAAILTVYGAGSWRTRGEDRRFGAEGQMRPVRPVSPSPVPVVSASAAITASASDPAPPALPAASEPQRAPSKSLKTEPAPSTPAALPQSSEPATAAVALATVEEKSEPAAEAAVAAEEAEPAPPSHKPWLDGYYTGWGTSRHGDIQVFVTIKDGRIVTAGIATCETRYPCSVINNILLQPIDLQGPDVDRVSRATESGDAYYYGLVQALGNAETGTFRSARP